MKSPGKPKVSSISPQSVPKRKLYLCLPILVWFQTLFLSHNPWSAMGLVSLMIVNSRNICTNMEKKVFKK